MILPYVYFSSFKLEVIYNKKVSSQIYFDSFLGNSKEMDISKKTQKNPFPPVQSNLKMQ